MKTYLDTYLAAQKAALDSIPTARVAELIEKFREALEADRQIFVFGNGGSAASASHFITDLSKGASDQLTNRGDGRRFRAMSLNDNVPWMTALANDYSYDEIYARQLMNFARPGDLVMTMSVSGSSPNLVRAFEWAKQAGVYTIALVGGKRGKLADLADFSIVIDDQHYGRVEDAHMAICHLICYAFMEAPEPPKGA